jgi:RNA polymerase sigma-70 factor (ECF subfamily)
MDEKVFTQLVLEHQDMLFRVAYTLLRHREDCKDVMQDALMKAWKSIRTLRSPDAFRSWILRIVTNCAKDMLRKRKLQMLPLQEDAATADMPAEDTRLKAALEQLGEGMRLPIILYYLEGLSVQETARAMGLPQATVRSRLSRGRKRLAAALHEVEEEDQAWYSTVINC